MPTSQSTPITLDTLRSYAVRRTLFSPTTLPAAIKRLGFVQADPIRAPARAQDLTLRHRVKGYVAGDLERRYAALGIEEDFFVNYGFVPRATQALMHPRTPRTAWPAARAAQAQAVLAFVQARGVVQPREVDAHFAHGRATTWFGGTSNASTQLLDAMHYRGMLRIAGRTSGVRTYAVPVASLQTARHSGSSDPTHSPEQALDALIDVIAHKYAPLPERSLSDLVRLLRGSIPQWDALRPAALARAKQRLARAVVAGTTWYWPQAESLQGRNSAKHIAAVGAGDSAKRQAEQGVGPDTVRLLAPFDPLVWDRRRFELLWGWAYRFEAYTPAAKRVRGYYALPLLWREQVIGWGNVSFAGGALSADIGYVAGKRPREAAYTLALDEELERMRLFLAPKE
jgi:uncharacterized protein